MQTLLTSRSIEMTAANIRPNKPLPLRLTEVPARRHPIRVSFPLPSREACLTRRAMIAALRDAEFHDWLNGGDDFADAMHQPVH